MRGLSAMLTGGEMTIHHLRAKSRLRRLRSETHLRVQSQKSKIFARSPEKGSLFYPANAGDGENGTEEQNCNQENQVEIPVATFLPIAEIHPVGIVPGSEQQRGHVISGVQQHPAKPGADSHFEESVKRKCAEIGAQDRSGITIAGHQNGRTQRENVLKADIQNHQKGQDEGTAERKQEMPGFGQQHGAEDQHIAHENANAGGHKPGKVIGIDGTGKHQQADGQVSGACEDEQFPGFKEAGNRGHKGKGAHKGGKHNEEPGEGMVHCQIADEAGQQGKTIGNGGNLDPGASDDPEFPGFLF